MLMGIFSKFNNSKYGIYIFMFFLIIFKLCLVQTLPIYSISTLVHDDQLMVNMANSLLDGKWLGAYNNLTLVKGLFFPLFLASNNILGISYLASSTLFYACACVVFIVAMQKMLKSKVILCMAFTILLFNPITFATQTFLVVYRNNITPGQVLLVVASFSAIFLRKNDFPLRILPWSILAGISLASLWLTREDSIWIVPFVLVSSIVILIAILFQYKSIKKLLFIKKIGLVVLPMFILFFSTFVVSCLNYYVYGIFTTNELNNSNFTKAMKSIYAVTPSETIPYVSVPRTTVERLYEISPSLKSIETSLEDSLNSWDNNDRNPNDTQVEDGWFFWALRDAVANSGYYKDAKTANAFYAKISKEIEDALDNDMLKRRSIMPSALMSPWRNSYFKDLPVAFLKAFKFVVGYEDLEFTIPVSVENETGNGIRLAERVTNNLAVRPPHADHHFKGWFANISGDFNLKITNSLGDIISDIEMITSPDVESHLNGKNISAKNSDFCRFDLTVDSQQKMDSLFLSVYNSDNGKLVQMIPLDGSVVADYNENYAFNFDTITVDPLQNSFLHRSKFINFFINIYQKTGWIAFGLGCFSYLYITYILIQSCIKRKVDISAFNVWLIATGFLFSLIVLVGGVSYNEIASCNSIIYKYLSGAYPLLLCFWMLPLFYLFERLKNKTELID